MMETIPQRYELIPVEFLENDSEASMEQVPREITSERLIALQRLSPSLPMIQQKTGTRRFRYLVGRRMKILRANLCKVERVPSLISKDYNFLKPKNLRGIDYEGSRLKRFFKTITEGNLPALEFVLRKESRLLLEAREPTTGYNTFLVAALIPNVKRRCVVLHFLLDKLDVMKRQTRHGITFEEGRICDLVLEAYEVQTGQDCLGLMCSRGPECLAQKLLNSLLVSVEFTKETFDGSTYLHLALQSGMKNLVALLVHYMQILDIDATKLKNSFKQTPLDIASLSNDEELRTLVKSLSR